jgi:hypothetical protein
MKFAELEVHADSLPSEQVVPTLHELMRDPRFGAVLRLLHEHRRSLVAQLSAPGVAANPAAGTMLAHYAGALDALLSFEQHLLAICEDPASQQ